MISFRGLYHAIVCLSKIHASVAASESTAGKGEGTGQRESPSPAFLRDLCLYIYKGLNAQGMIAFESRLESNLIGGIQAVVRQYLVSFVQAFKIAIEGGFRYFQLSDDMAT